jgi:MFS family permease
MNQQIIAAQPETIPASPAAQRRWTLALGLYSITSNSLFSNAIWLIYLAAHGYTPFQIGLFETLFHIAKFVAEAPTGVFADLVGRRASLIVSSALSSLAPLLFLFPTFPALVALGFALSGLGFAFRGGAESAMIWRLAELSGAPDRAARFSRLFSRIVILGLLAAALSVSAGGFLSDVSVALPFVAQSLVIALGIGPLLLLPEKRLAHAESHNPFAHFGAGIRAVWHDPWLLALLLLSALSASVFTTVGFYNQLYFYSLGFTLAAIGVIYGASYALDALYTLFAPRLIARLPAPRLLAIFLGAEALGLLAMSLRAPWLGVAGFLLLFHLSDAVLYPALNTYLNQRAPEEQRATVLSLDTGLFSGAMIVLFPLFGFGLTSIPYDVAYKWTLAALVGGSLLIVGGALWLTRLRGKRPALESE